MIALNGRYDGKVIVPDTPLDLPADQAVRITVEPIATPPASSAGKRVLGQQPGLVLHMAPDWDEPLPDLPDNDQESPDVAPDETLHNRRSHSALVEAMGSLSADHRAVVDLTYFHGLGYREIAEIMDCPIDTVKTRMFHARRKLKTVIPGEARDWL